MADVKLENDQDKANWLACLAAAASMANGSGTKTVAELTDRLYRDEFLKRCGETL